MTIAFDIDGTWTADRNSFWRFAHTLERAGWAVIIVTGSEQPIEKLKALWLETFPHHLRHQHPQRNRRSIRRLSRRHLG